jgi:hypothetical protein
MTIVSVDKMWSRSGGNANLSDNFRKLSISFEEAYQVVTTVGTTELEVFQAPGIPAAGSSFPGFPFCYAESAKIQQVSPIFWIVSISYNGEIAPSAGGGTASTNPLLAPPKIDWDDVETEEEIDEDFDGNPIVTANNEPIYGVKAPFPDQTVTIRRNMSFFNSYVQARYRRATNSDTFLGWPPGTARVVKYSGSNVYDATFGYWEVTATIQFRFPYRTTADKAWYSRVRHEGFYEKVTVGSGTAIVRAADERGEPVTKPVLLDEDGYRVTDPANTYWLEFKKYDSLPFNALGLL